jgi:hypothetical protein
VTGLNGKRRRQGTNEPETACGVSCMKRHARTPEAPLWVIGERARYEQDGLTLESGEMTRRWVCITRCDLQERRLHPPTASCLCRELYDWQSQGVVERQPACSSHALGKGGLFPTHDPGGLRLSPLSCLPQRYSPAIPASRTRHCLLNSSWRLRPSTNNTFTGPAGG